MMERVSANQRVMVDTIWPMSGLLREVLLILTGSLLIAAAAQIKIPLPFSPVPITGQTFAVLLLAALYGSKRGLATVITYLALGVAGMPIFAGAVSGIAPLIGPTGGYLVGFLAAAYLVGLLSERGWDRKPWSTAVSMVIGNAIIYALGVLWLAYYVGWGNVLSTGVLPFLPGDIIKIGLATILLPAGWKLIRGWERR
jgi:biotin transport system substrate-specific component